MGGSNAGTPLEKRWAIEIFAAYFENVIKVGALEVDNGTGQKEWEEHELPAAGRWLCLGRNVTNLGPTPARFDGAEFVVTDAQGRSYQPDALALRSQQDLLRGSKNELKGPLPNARYGEYLSFDVSVDATGLVLRSSDGSFALPIPVRE